MSDRGAHVPPVADLGPFTLGAAQRVCAGVYQLGRVVIEGRLNHQTPPSRGNPYWCETGPQSYIRFGALAHVWLTSHLIRRSKAVADAGGSLPGLHSFFTGERGTSSFWLPCLRSTRPIRMDGARVVGHLHQGSSASTSGGFSRKKADPIRRTLAIASGCLAAPCRGCQYQLARCHAARGRASSEALTRRTASASPNRRRRVKYLADQVSRQPPLRPLAPAPHRSLSRMTMSRCDACCLARIAVHGPVKPPPTMQTGSSVAGPNRPRRKGRHRYFSSLMKRVM